MLVLTSVVAAVFGAIVGSFLNVVVHRLPRGESVVRPRSRCPQCETPLSWYDNVPVLSYLLLGGACRRCGRPISWTYPTVEATTAVLFAALVIRFGPTLEAALYAVFVSLLTTLLWIDLEWMLLPDRLTLGGAAAGLLAALSPGAPGPLDAVLGAAFGAGVLLLTRWLYWVVRGRRHASGAAGSDPTQADAASVSEGAFGASAELDEEADSEALETLALREGIGLGDVKMLAMIGAWLGWNGALYVLVVGALLGSLVGIGGMLLWRRRGTVPLPFGTFLALAATLWLFFGEEILWAYTRWLTRWLAF